MNVFLLLEFAYQRRMKRLNIKEIECNHFEKEREKEKKGEDETEDIHLWKLF